MSPADQTSTQSPLIDTRRESAFGAAHVPGAVSLPLEQLSSRSHELPRVSESIRVTDSDELRLEEAAHFLRRRGHVVIRCAWDGAKATATGPSAVRLWKPNEFLVEALDRIGSGEARRGRALDVASGSGRDAVYLALLGYNVEAIDLLPDALKRAEDLARRNGVTIATRAQDLERDAVLPAEHYDLVCVFRYLQRGLFPALGRSVRPGGHLVYETFHERNRNSGLKPRSPEHLLKTGELVEAFAGFDLLICRDAHQREGRFFSSVLARRPG